MEKESKPEPDAPKLTEAQRLEEEGRIRTIAAGDDLTLASRTLKRARDRLLTIGTQGSAVQAHRILRVITEIDDVLAAITRHQ